MKTLNKIVKNFWDCWSKNFSRKLEMQEKPAQISEKGTFWKNESNFQIPHFQKKLGGLLFEMETMEKAKWKLWIEFVAGRSLFG